MERTLDMFPTLYPGRVRNNGDKKTGTKETERPRSRYLYYPWRKVERCSV